MTKSWVEPKDDIKRIGRIVLPRQNVNATILYAPELDELTSLWETLQCPSYRDTKRDRNRRRR